MTNGILGGAMIGTAAGLLYLGAGRIAGISGILARGLDPAERDRAWRWLFVAGLVLGAALVDALAPGALPGRYDASTLRVVAAGALVGVGARLANGCTSGHGLCGVARRSHRSFAALATFLATGALTVLVARALGAAR
jgi:uncharacterized membrane protein YedE/YeeE